MIGSEMVKLKELASRCMLKIESQKDMDGDGKIEKRQFETAIIYKNGLSPKWRRFMVAHMISHFLLGHLLYKPEGIVYRENIDRIRNPKEEEEERANSLALKILMPEKEVQKAVGRFGLDIQKLSEFFKVPEMFVQKRIEELQEIYGKTEAAA